jgi:uncharacterized protein (DUF2141 family)
LSSHYLVRIEYFFKNMRPVHIMLLAITALGGAKMATAQQYKITVTIIGLRSDKGTLYLSLYNSAEGYPKKASDAFRLSCSSILNGKCTIILDDIPKGVYAIACYHDENNNGKIDTNFFGIPVEGTGASNNAKGSWGPPKFQDAKFIVNNDTNQIIKIVY